MTAVNLVKRQTSEVATRLAELHDDADVKLHFYVLAEDIRRMEQRLAKLQEFAKAAQWYFKSNALWPHEEMRRLLNELDPVGKGSAEDDE